MSKRLLYATVLGLLLNACQKEGLLTQNENILPEVVLAENENESDTETLIGDSAKNWIYNMQRPSGLMESSENSNFVSLYDNALAAIFFISEGKRENAEQILDFFNDNMQTELLSGTGGFYQFRNIKGENGNRVWLGDNAWLLIALNHYHEYYSSNKYDELTDHLNIWIRSLQEENGALKGGYNEDGSAIPKVTEGIITAYNAIKGFDDFHQKILQFIETERWDAENHIFLAWPENPKHAYALDLHSLGSAIFPELSHNLLEETNRFLNNQTFTLNGENISGYCFDEDKDVVWLEGTAQMALAFQSNNRLDTSNTILTNLEKTFIQSSSYNNSKGIPYTTNQGTSYGEGLLWDHADITPTLSSTIWYLFAKKNFDPLSLNHQKAIPAQNKFWVENTIN
ncbi:hypothetical protein [Maribacter sp. 2304DJ31-5]|uniref:hypothetical protein n=1 Tax=Maribacter sp. 2304DJ31-5 TaxID=3386273 RepID=UPI0039BD4F36